MNECSIQTERHFSACASLAAIDVKVRQLDLFSPVRDVFHIGGFLVFDPLGQIIQIVLNRSAPLTPALVASLMELLTPAHIASSLGESNMTR